MLRITGNDFVEKLTLTEPIDDKMFTWDNIRYFDNDGFQLSKLEQLFYQANGIDLEYINGVYGAQSEWIESDDPNFVVDHSMLIARCNYGGAALDQINKFAEEIPYLKKYTKIRPKWGIDFALEYINDDTFLEVIHLELDFIGVEFARNAKQRYERRIQNTDWEAFTELLLLRRDDWAKLEGMHRNNWKAQLWGMPYAEDILKVV